MTQLATLNDVKKVISRPDFKSGTFYFQPDEGTGPKESVSVTVRKILGDKMEISATGRDNKDSTDIDPEYAMNGALAHLKSFAKQVGLPVPQPKDTEVSIDELSFLDFIATAKGKESVDSARSVAESMADKGVHWVELECKPNPFKTQHYRWDG